MKIVVVDAAAVVEVLFNTPAGQAYRERLEPVDVDLHVPELCDVEVASAVRRALRQGVMSLRRGEEALEDYFDLPLSRHRHGALVGRILQLRDNFSAYDATYVALAEELEATLITADRRLRQGVETHLPGLRVE